MALLCLLANEGFYGSYADSLVFFCHMLMSCLFVSFPETGRQSLLLRRWCGSLSVFQEHSSYRHNVCVPPKFVCGNLTPNGMAFGGGAFERWWGNEGWNPHQWGLDPYNRDRRGPPHPCPVWGHGKKTAVYEPGRGFFTDTELAGVWISDFQSPELSEINVCCLSCPLYGSL